MDKKEFFKWLKFITIGLFGSFLLLIISELIKFSHLNLLPFGGSSWAVWFHPLAIGISFYMSSIISKLGKPMIIFIFITLISAVIFYFLYGGLLFVNPTPFGIGAASI